MLSRKTRHSSSSKRYTNFGYVLMGSVLVGAIGGWGYFQYSASKPPANTNTTLSVETVNHPRTEVTVAAQTTVSVFEAEEQFQQDHQAYMEEARARSQLRSHIDEEGYYATPQLAKKAIEAKWTLIPAVASPGDMILVRHQSPADLTWQGKKVKLQQFGSGYYAYVSIPISLKPGTYPIGNQTLSIIDKKFETQYLKVTKQMESMRQDTARIEADQKKINAARSKSEPTFLFTNDFMQPIEGTLTTPYGYTRYVNNKLDNRHTALDLAAPEGTPIHATNDGVVALADSLYLTGNAIYLDHGMNLFSQYAHMSKVLVKTGDRVKKGDVIGLVGTTGFSTGPHLHFTFWANNTPVNPNLFFKTTPFHWLQDSKKAP
ncbi:M23 family metallopeptidase [Paenibacillus sp. N1-5-1-14]|uniref:M23 family metallopeptidase n=1 Tax=Paenibacillus radicibacter TaxID=2972488 RepID=UPI0021590289|nr:M23 family metallopeptidase [Paenibacillus radicibacter]MCR8642788.1 M23 family metallopeptidase [Paenibacillus radicibacter]